MSNLHALKVREANGALNNSITVGTHVLGMPFTLSTRTDIKVIEKWMEWHDKWETMDKGTQDSYLVLLALKGDQ